MPVDKISWHTFRHCDSSLVRRAGADIKVQQELLRHSTIRPQQRYDHRLRVLDVTELTEPELRQEVLKPITGVLRR